SVCPEAALTCCDTPNGVGWTAEDGCALAGDPTDPALCEGEPPVCCALADGRSEFLPSAERCAALGGQPAEPQTCEPPMPEVCCAEADGFALRPLDGCETPVAETFCQEAGLVCCDASAVGQGAGIVSRNLCIQPAQVVEPSVCDAEALVCCRTLPGQIGWGSAAACALAFGEVIGDARCRP
ncbi:MAG: hypothetical protein KC583_19180, partial [Myxococcales bacterium]|nr:hypothetical protein [Myxococcales bacterium]